MTGRGAGTAAALLLSLVCVAGLLTLEAQADTRKAPPGSRPGPAGGETPRKTLPTPKPSRATPVLAKVPQIVAFSSSVSDCPLYGPRSPLLSFEVKGYPRSIEIRAVYEDGHTRTFYTRKVTGAESVAVAGIRDPGVETGVTGYLLVAGAIQKRLRFRIPHPVAFEVASNGRSRVRERHGDSIVVGFTFPATRVSNVRNFRALGRSTRGSGEVFVPLQLYTPGPNLNGKIATYARDYPGFASILNFEVAADSDGHLGCPVQTLRHRNVQVPQLAP